MKLKVFERVCGGRGSAGQQALQPLSPLSKRPLLWAPEVVKKGPSRDSPSGSPPSPLCVPRRVVLLGDSNQRWLFHAMVCLVAGEEVGVVATGSIEGGMLCLCRKGTCAWKGGGSSWGGGE